MTTDSVETKRKGILSEGIILTACSAYVYFITFVYESGYCGYFRIPYNLINPNYTTVLMTAATIVTAIASSFATINAIFALSRYMLTPIKKEQAWLVANVLILLAGFLFWFFVQIWWLVLPLTIIALLVFNGVWFYSLHVQRGEHLNGQPRTQNPIDANDLFTYLDNKIGAEAVLLGLIMLSLVPYVVHLMGLSEAMHQQRFLILDSQPDYAVIRIYSDTAIAVQIDREGKSIGDGILLLHVPSKDRLELHSESIGPLSDKLPVRINADLQNVHGIK